MGNIYDYRAPDAVFTRIPSKSNIRTETGISRHTAISQKPKTYAGASSSTGECLMMKDIHVVTAEED